MESLIPKIKISLVVIGQNDLSSLRKIYSEDYLREIGRHIGELIYVDSASSDGSKELMQKLGFSVFVISKAELCNASAGRHVGTSVARGEFVLFLDSDMKLENPGSFFASILRSITKNFVGVVCTVKDIYPNSSERIRLRKAKPDGTASSFGGGVLLHRTSIISVGNWNFRLAANEELDLQVRIERSGGKILFLPQPTILHFTRQPSRLHELLNLYVPGRSVRYGSWGKLLAQQTDWQARATIINRNREAPFLVLTLVILSINVFAGALAFVIYQLDLLSRRSVAYNVVVPGIALSMIIGLLLPRNHVLDIEYDAL